MGEFLSVTFFALGVVSWMMPTWAGDNLKKAGMVMGVYLGILFVAIQTYHVSTGAANLDLMSMVPAIIFPILFYWKSSASD
jgi:Leu/Phe-tRNA-protein transferase